MKQKTNRKISRATETQKKEIAFGVQRRLINKKQEYIRNKLNGNYFLARSNMIADQLNSGKIKEKIDGMIKTVEYIRAELGLMRMQAFTSMRNAFFAKNDLLGEFKLTEKDIDDLEQDYYSGKIIRDDYDDAYRQKSKAEFVNPSKD